MNKSPAYQRYPDKWLADTRRLSWTTKGMYADLIEIIWMQFQDTCSIPNDDAYIAAELGCSLAEWEASKAEIMCEYNPLMTITESNRLLSGGLLKEAVKQRVRREQLAENGRKGGRPKKQKVISEKPKRNQNKSLPSPTPSLVPSPTPKKPQPKRCVFVPPAPIEVESYCAEIEYPMDGQAWCDSYEAKGWMVGKNKMKSWKAAVRNWKSNNWQPTATRESSAPVYTMPPKGTLPPGMKEMPRDEDKMA